METNRQKIRAGYALIRKDTLKCLKLVRTALASPPARTGRAFPYFTSQTLAWIIIAIAVVMHKPSGRGLRLTVRTCHRSILSDIREIHDLPEIGRMSRPYIYPGII